MVCLVVLAVVAVGVVVVVVVVAPRVIRRLVPDRRLLLRLLRRIRQGDVRGVALLAGSGKPFSWRFARLSLNLCVLSDLLPGPGCLLSGCLVRTGRSEDAGHI